MSKAALSIGKLARKSGTSVRMLRYFEGLGLLRPVRLRRRRFFQADDRNHVAVIKVYQALGMGLKTVRRLREALSAGATEAAIRISQHEADRVDVEITKLQKQRFFIGRLQDKLAKSRRPHTYHCYLCDTRDDMTRNWWGAMLDLICEPCIVDLHGKLLAKPGDLGLQCAACGSVGRSPAVAGVDGSICRECLERYVESMQSSEG